MGSTDRFDVAVVGGGPAGSTMAVFLKKYCPDLSVVVLERDKFPRDHVGESLLPVVCRVLNSMGCWDAIEKAGFPVKVGATYRWGTSDDLWDFDFLAGQPYEDLPRPGSYSGQRRNTAFQVDRSIFDEILLRHAESAGVEIREQTRVVEVCHENKVVTGLRLGDETRIEARYYIDASGHSGILRRTVGVEISEPSTLKNIAVWRYWNDADWAVSIGASGTRVQVLSLGWGWIWVIPITATRTSIGLVLPADYYLNSGKKPAELYEEAISTESSVRGLIKAAAVEREVYTTKDWSFMATEMARENWFIIGEAAGFADPILAAGISMAMVGAQEAAITIAELERGKLDAKWLKSEFERNQFRRIQTHIQFADYWYTSNSHFSDLVEYTSTLAAASGIPLTGRAAWQWLGTGGFVQLGEPGIAGYGLSGTKWIVDAFQDDSLEWNISGKNVFNLNLEGARREEVAVYHDGAIEPIPAIIRGDKMLPARGVYRFMVQALTRSNRVQDLVERIQKEWLPSPESGVAGLRTAVESLEAMTNDGWVSASYDPTAPPVDLAGIASTPLFHKNIDNVVGI